MPLLWVLAISTATLLQNGTNVNPVPRAKVHPADHQQGDVVIQVARSLCRSIQNDTLLPCKYFHIGGSM